MARLDDERAEEAQKEYRIALIAFKKAKDDLDAVSTELERKIVKVPVYIQEDV